ncbi:MAG: hypothetical protein OEM38_09260 [Gammaproteobacteria bacterium]|nr:hypothetical protein [Gammaproteobacteria bacterium]
MNQIPLEKLTKDELITLINTHSYIRTPDATRVYYESRAKKNQKESEKVRTEIDEVLEAQKITSMEFNLCRDLNEKMKLAKKLSSMESKWLDLNKKWEILYKKGNAIFAECYGD